VADTGTVSDRPLAKIPRFKQSGRRDEFSVSVLCSYRLRVLRESSIMAAVQRT
jgi:hypothetical protein